MKHTLQLLGLGLLLAALSGCDTYIEGRGHAHGSGYRRGPSHGNSDHHDSRRRSSGSSLNTNIGVGLGL
ncbi:MAG: hypothetical protein Q8M07_21855 [Prosthecobacter sp.]|nr:hypothetical protein [Prosthecobacter sp.]